MTNLPSQVVSDKRSAFVRWISISPPASFRVASRPWKGRSRLLFVWVEISQTSPRSIRNVTSDKSDGSSDECLSVEENALQTGEKWSFRSVEALSLFRPNGALCHQQYLSNCVCVWFSDFSLYLLPAASQALCEQEPDWLCSQGLFNAFPCHSVFFVLVHQ